MLYLYPTYVARNYLLLVVVLSFLVIQLAARRADLNGLLLENLSLSRAVRRWLAAAVAAIAVAAFLHFSPDVFAPGLAGSELIAVFAAGVLLSLTVSAVGGQLRTGRSRPLAPAPIGTPQELPVADYTVQELKPSGLASCLVVVLSDPDLPLGEMRWVCEAAVVSGARCLLVDWGPSRAPRFPDALAVVPMCLSLLGKGEEHGLVVGFGVAGDLALRSAADDLRITRVLAVDPALTAVSSISGMRLLRSMSVLEAWRWQRRWSRGQFVQQLRSTEAARQLGPGTTLVVSSTDGFHRAIRESRALHRAAGVRVLETRVSHRALLREVAPVELQAVVGQCTETGATDG